MEDLELKTIVSRKLRDAIGYQSSEITRERQTNLEYYLAEPFGNEIEGRSSVISRDVMDTIEWMLPPLMAMFHGSENAVEYAPAAEGDEPIADQATDYINYIYTVDNPGFMVTYTWIKDALIQKVGVVKVYAEEVTEETTDRYENVLPHDLAVLTEEEGVEVVSQDETEAVDPQTGMPLVDMMTQQPVPAFSLELKRTTTRQKICVTNIPPEEFFIERRARSMEEARFVAHKTQKTRTELIEEGHDAAIVNGLPAFTGGDDGSADEEKDVRFEGEEYDGDNPDAADKATDLIDICEAVLWVDYDGDGKAERRKVITAGHEHTILANDEFEDPLFIDFCPTPTPHTFWGMSVADQVRDVQLVKSTLIRGMLDGLYQSLDPMKTIIPDWVGDYMDDYVSPAAPGKWYRAMRPDAVTFHHRIWEGEKAFPMLEYWDKVREGRTGVSQTSMGTNPELMHNQTATAVNQAMTASQQRVEMIARIFAESFKRLFRALLKLTVRYQDKERVIRLRDKFVPVDPRVWNSDMDVKINVGIGSGNKDRQIAHLMAILSQQKEALGSPIGRMMVTPGHIYSTLEQITKAAGFASVDTFFRDPSSEEAVQEAQAAAQQQQQDPTALIASLEIAKLMLDAREAQLKDDRERDKMEADIELQASEIQAKYGTQVNVALIRALMARERPPQPMGPMGQGMQPQAPMAQPGPMRAA